MERIVVIAAVISLLIVVLTAAILSTPQHPTPDVKETTLYPYQISVRGKTYLVTLETNWTAQKTPTVSVSNSSLTPYAVTLHFLGGSKATMTYNFTIPTGLLSGDISLMWKYYVQNPDRYVLTCNSTHTTLHMTFSYDPYFSGSGYFEVLGTEGAW